jgi:hypothetical protein
VPDHLREQHGSGMETPVLNAEACAALAAHLVNPVHAARAVLTLLTGLGKRDLSAVSLDDLDERGAAVTADARYLIPPPVRPPGSTPPRSTGACTARRTIRLCWPIPAGSCAPSPAQA